MRYSRTKDRSCLVTVNFDVLERTERVGIVTPMKRDKFAKRLRDSRHLVYCTPYKPDGEAAWKPISFMETLNINRDGYLCSGEYVFRDLLIDTGKRTYSVFFP